MNQNWIKNSSGEWVNLSRIDRVYIISFGEGYKIMLVHADGESKPLDDHVYENRCLAQNKLDSSMGAIIWDD